MASPLRNLLLEALANETGPDLIARFEPVSLPFQAVLFEAEETPRYIHFVTSGAASVVATMQDGEIIEVGFTGREGCPEGMYLLGPQTATRKCFVQIEGTALRMRFREFQELYLANPVLNRLIARWVQYEGFMLGQIAACNGLHMVEQRLARWLLMVHDRIGQVHLPLTQDLLGQMLGARRSTVTLAAGNLQRAGLIDYRRGHIWIHNREGLQDVACECYPMLRRLFDDLYSRMEERPSGRGGRVDKPLDTTQ